MTIEYILIHISLPEKTEPKNSSAPWALQSLVITPLQVENDVPSPS